MDKTFLANLLIKNRQTPVSQQTPEHFLNGEGNFEAHTAKPALGNNVIRGTLKLMFTATPNQKRQIRRPEILSNNTTLHLVLDRFPVIPVISKTYRLHQ
jgi:hypothetical protein